MTPNTKSPSPEALGAAVERVQDFLIVARLSGPSLRWNGRELHFADLSLILARLHALEQGEGLSQEAPGHTDLMVTPESIGPWLAQIEAAKVICDFMNWPEDGPAWDDANKLARQLREPSTPTQVATRKGEDR